MNQHEQFFSDIRKRYPVYVTQKQFASLAGICLKTVHKMTKNGFIPYREVRSGFHHHYEIPTEALIRYLESRLPETDQGMTLLWKDGLYHYLEHEADVLRLRDVVRISGIGKNSVDRWIKAGRLKVFMCRHVYRVTKEDLILYLSSSYYRGAHRKPKEWHQIRAYVEAYAIRKMKQ